MGELIHALGIDWRLLLANIVTFLLVLWILRKFAFKPILKILDDRRALAQNTVDLEKTARAALDGAEGQRHEIIGQARREGGDLMVNARAEAEAMKQRIIDEAKGEAMQIATETKAELQRERLAMVAAAKKDLADLVVAAAGALVEGKAGTAFDKQSADEVMKHVKS